MFRTVSPGSSKHTVRPAAAPRRGLLLHTYVDGVAWRRRSGWRSIDLWESWQSMMMMLMMERSPTTAPHTMGWILTLAESFYYTRVRNKRTPTFIIFWIFFQGLRSYYGLKRHKFYYISSRILRSYVYSFCQIFQTLRLFKGLRLFRTLE